MECFVRVYSPRTPPDSGEMAISPGANSKGYIQRQTPLSHPHQPTSIPPSPSTQRENHKHMYGPSDRTLAPLMKSTITVDSESSSCVNRARMYSTHIGMPDSAPSQMSRTRVNELSVCPPPTASSSSPLPDLWAGVEAWAWRHATRPRVCWQPRRQSSQRSSRSDGV